MPSRNTLTWILGIASAVFILSICAWIVWLKFITDLQSFVWTITTCNITGYNDTSSQYTADVYTKKGYQQVSMSSNLFVKPDIGYNITCCVSTHNGALIVDILISDCYTGTWIASGSVLIILIISAAAGIIISLCYIEKISRRAANAVAPGPAVMPSIGT